MLLEERKQWRRAFEQGDKPTSPLLTDYRKGRNRESFRLSRVVEEICEYVLYLEDRLSEYDLDKD